MLVNKIKTDYYCSKNGFAVHVYTYFVVCRAFMKEQANLFPNMKWGKKSPNIKNKIQPKAKQRRSRHL